jgi:FGGY-family pentulose kinase
VHARSARHGESTGAWDSSFWQAAGLGELSQEAYRRIGTTVRPMGEAIASGLSATSARSLGLRVGTPVGVGIIDAHAGGLGLIGAVIEGRGLNEVTCDRRLVLIGGTSSCHMALSPRARFIRGVWGPYYSTMVPGFWLTEGGQSATGALIDHCIDSSRHAPALRREAGEQQTTVYSLLNDRLTRLAGSANIGSLTCRLHVLGDHHGNRSPRADALARGAVSGLTLNDELDDLARAYLATVQAVAYGTRHIIDTLNAGGYRIDTLLACGGGTKNPVFLQQHADITGCAIMLGGEPEAVLLGTAILGAVAARAYSGCVAAMAAMTGVGREIRPQAAMREFHDRKYRVYLRMYEDRLGYNAIMECARAGRAPRKRVRRVAT